MNFILKEWCTISRGAEPHAQKVNDEKVLKRVAHTCGVIWAERSDGPDYTTSVYYYIYIYIHNYIYIYIYITQKHANISTTSSHDMVRPCAKRRVEAPCTCACSLSRLRSRLWTHAHVGSRGSGPHILRQILTGSQARGCRVGLKKAPSTAVGEELRQVNGQGSSSDPNGVWL